MVALGQLQHDPRARRCLVLNRERDQIRGSLYVGRRFLEGAVRAEQTADLRGFQKPDQPDQTRGHDQNREHHQHDARSAERDRGLVANVSRHRERIAAFIRAESTRGARSQGSS